MQRDAEHEQCDNCRTYSCKTPANETESISIRYCRKLRFEDKWKCIHIELSTPKYSNIPIDTSIGVEIMTTRTENIKATKNLPPREVRRRVMSTMRLQCYTDQWELCHKTDTIYFPYATKYENSLVLIVVMLTPNGPEVLGQLIL